MTDAGSRNPAALKEAVYWIKDRLSHGRLGRRVFEGALRTMIVVGAGAVVSFGVQLALARRLGTEGYGVYVLVFGWLAIAQVIGRLEVDSIMTRFVASYVSSNRWDLLRGLLTEGRRTVVIVSVVAALLGAGLTYLLRRPLNNSHPHYDTALYLACLILPAANLLQVESGALLGFQKFARAQLPQSLFRPVVLALLLTAIVTLGPGSLVAHQAVAANFVAVLVALSLAVYWRARATPVETRQVAPAYERSHWARTALPLVAVSLGHIVISQQADILIVGTYLDTAQAGVYGAAAQLTIPLGLALTSVTYVAQPMIADLYVRKELGRIQSLIRVTTWGSAFLSLVVAGSLILAGPWLLGLYGPGFRAGYPVLVVLTLANVAHGTGGHLAGYLLTMTEHERAAASITLACSLLNALLALLLTPIYGPVGTASATLTTALVRTLVMRLYIRRTMGLVVPKF